MHSLLKCNAVCFWYTCATFCLCFCSQDLHICLLASEASVQSHNEDVNSSNKLIYLVICNYDGHDPNNLFKQETTPSKHFVGNLFLPFLRNFVLESGQYMGRFCQVSMPWVNPGCVHLAESIVKLPTLWH